MLRTMGAWRVIVGASGARFWMEGVGSDFSLGVREGGSTAAARGLFLEEEIVKPRGRGMMVGRIRQGGSACGGRGGMVHVGTMVLVTLLWVKVHVLTVRVSHLVLVIVWALGVMVMVLVAAGLVMVMVDSFGTEVVV